MEGPSFDGISITVGNVTINLDDSFNFESLDISLGAMGLAVGLSVDSDGEVDYNISINGVSIVGGDAEFEVSDSIGPPSANITIGAKPSDKDIDITINIAAISARFSVQLPDSTSKSGNNPSLEAENPNLPGIPFGELGLYGNNSDSDSSTSNGDVGQSIGLDAFGGEGEDVDSGQDGGGGPDGGDPGSGFGGKPIVLDLDGDGLELVALEESTAFFDLDGDGYRERVAWVSADDGFLAYDKDGDGAIAAHDELSFVGYVEGAQTDLEGLSHFDTNGNGELDPGDADWSKFRVWQDLNRDGESDPGELRTLTEAGISSIPLTGDGVERSAIAA